MLIQCTKKLAEELRSDASMSKPTEPHPFYSWHAHLFILNRRKSVLVMNNKTRYNFLLTGLKKADFSRFGEVVVQGITENLLAEKIDQSIVEQYIQQCGKVSFASTSDRGVISQMNEMIRTIKYWNEADQYDGIKTDFYELNRKLNRYIMLKLPKYSGEMMLDELRQLDKIKELDEAETARKKLESVEENKYKIQINKDFMLKAALTHLTKEDLHQIRSHLNIGQASSLNKQELIGVLCEQIPVKVNEQILLFDDERYQFVQKAVNNGGYIFFSDMENRQLEYYKHRGLLYLDHESGKKLLRMPREILEAFKAIQDSSIKPIIRKNTEWIKLSRGLLYYYGTLSIDLLKSKLQTYMGTKMDDGFKFILKDSIDYAGEIKLDSRGFSNDRVFSSEQVQQEHLSRPDLNYNVFLKNQLLLAGVPGFIDRNQAYQEFVDFLIKHFDVKNSKADMIAEECVYAIRIGQAPSDMLIYLQYQVDINSMDQIQGVMGKLTHLINHTRQWFLKGHTSETVIAEEKKALKPSVKDENLQRESIVYDFRTKKKVGRNDPCPCGSDNKYKKCCGK